MAIKSSASNRGQGRGRGSRTGRGSHQGRGGRGRRFNRPEYKSSIRNFKVEVDNFGVVLGITAKQRESKDQNKKFSEKLKQYILQEFQNPEEIFILVRDLKDPTTFFKTSRTTALSTEDKKDLIMLMIQTEEIKQYV